INVNAASISKSKTNKHSTSYGTVNVHDKATKNNVTGAWTFSVSATGVITQGFATRAYASGLKPNPVLTNNGNTAQHSAVWTVYRTSSGQDTGSGGMSYFTFTYNPSTATLN
ncbi:hypothetical protein H7U28_19640, partial [Coprobacillus cateniformis]|nr:hypothetical protein [Coprobacillus cateniformis]